MGGVEVRDVVMDGDGKGRTGDWRALRFRRLREACGGGVGCNKIEGFRGDGRLQVAIFCHGRFHFGPKRRESYDVGGSRSGIEGVVQESRGICRRKHKGLGASGSCVPRSTSATSWVESQRRIWAT